MWARPLHSDVLPVPGGPCSSTTRFQAITWLSTCIDAKWTRRRFDDDSSIGNLDIGDDEFDRFDVHPRVRRRVRRVVRRSHPRNRRIRRRIRRNVDLHSVDPKDVKDEKAKAEPSGGYFGGFGRRGFGGFGRRGFGFGDGDGFGGGDGFFGRGD